MQYVRFAPTLSLERGDRVVVYGAGEYGIRTRQFLQSLDGIRIVAWVDKAFSQIGDEDITSPSVVFEIEYDYIVISVLSEDVMHEIYSWLIQGGWRRKKYSG